eukprot:gene9369-19431_t
MLSRTFYRKFPCISKSGIRTIFINTETTPNPHSMKFLPGQVILPENFGTGMDFKKGDLREVQRSPLAQIIFKIDGITGVFIGREFITITKTTDSTWQQMKPQVFSAILDFFAEGKPVISDTPQVSDTTILDTDDDIVATIKELIETRVRPSVQDDGGDIFYEGFNHNTGIVQLRLAGSCVGCPSSAVTLRQGVENMLKHYIPEVTGIEEVGGGELDDTQKLEFHPDAVSIPQLKPRPEAAVGTS